MFQSFDKHTMTAVFGDFEDSPRLPVKFEVCHGCQGKGSRVDPHIDGHGLSMEELNEDPEFKEAYFSGAYDRPCTECNGRGLVLEFDDSRATEEQRDEYEDAASFEAGYAVERAAERRMGY